MASSSLALVDVLAEIPDFRQSQGKRYSLTAVLSLAVAAILCGYKSYSAIAEWGRHYGLPWIAALGFTSDKTPCAATLHTILSALDKEALEARLAQWAQDLLHASSPLPEQQGESSSEEALAVDGKTLRGSKKQGALAAHLLSALSQRLGLTLFQHPVSDHTNEIGAILEMLKGLFLQGKILTFDALLTQRKVAQHLVDEGAAYVMMVKENQPELHAIIEGAIEGIPFYGQAAEVTETLDSGHGRIEERSLVATSVLAGQQEIWPGIEQVFCIERRRTIKKSGQQSEEVVYGVTSLSREQADAATLLKLVRGHWQIENQSHWVRDVTFGEDHSQVRVGSLPQAMAALRNVAIGLMRVAGESNIAKACRKFAAQPWQALALIGIYPRTE
jgi:predicted transposase YbfD/YdcC